MGCWACNSGSWKCRKRSSRRSLGHSRPARSSWDRRRCSLDRAPPVRAASRSRTRTITTSALTLTVVTARLTRQSSERKSTRLNASHVATWYAVFCLKHTPPTASRRPPAHRGASCLPPARRAPRHTLSLHDALPISLPASAFELGPAPVFAGPGATSEGSVTIAHTHNYNLGVDADGGDSSFDTPEFRTRIEEVVNEFTARDLRRVGRRGGS